jgi:hypothetical protein
MAPYALCSGAAMYFAQMEQEIPAVPRSDELDNQNLFGQSVTAVGRTIGIL